MAEGDLGDLRSGYIWEVGVSRKEKVAVDEEPGPSHASSAAAAAADRNRRQGGTFGGKNAIFDPIQAPSARAKAAPLHLSQNPHPALRDLPPRIAAERSRANLRRRRRRRIRTPADTLRFRS